MGKLTDPKWWTGRTDEQRARRESAKAGMRKAKADLVERVQADVERSGDEWRETKAKAGRQSRGEER